MEVSLWWSNRQCYNQNSVKHIIADTGPGLSTLDKARVFERFVRADKSGQSGSGLGLSIVQWVAEVHGIFIELLDNEPQGLIVQIKWETLP